MLDSKKLEGTIQSVMSYLTPTRLDKSQLYGEDVYLKCDCEQPVVRSFKIRGVLGKLLSLSEQDKKRQVVTISSGNQGVCVAYACALLGFKKPIIYVPETSPLPKIHKMEKHGATIIKIGKSFDEANVMAEKLIEDKGYIKVDCREDPEGVCGHATISYEILKQEPDIDIIIVPLGSGGSSIANGFYLKHKYPKVKLYGVESDKSPSLIENLKQKKWTKTYDTPEDCLLKSLVGGCAKHTYQMAKECIDQVLVVSDEEAGQAVSDLAKYEKVVCEPDSAAAYAAYKRYPELFKGKRVAIELSGGNIEDELFVDLLSRYY